MKARRASLLSCGHWVNVGTLIVSRDGKTWRCIDCALAAVPAERDGQRRVTASRT
jgi:hypothetical protein